MTAAAWRTDTATPMPSCLHALAIPNSKCQQCGCLSLRPCSFGCETSLLRVLLCFQIRARPLFWGVITHRIAPQLYDVPRSSNAPLAACAFRPHTQLVHHGGRGPQRHGAAPAEEVSLADASNGSRPRGLFNCLHSQEITGSTGAQSVALSSPAHTSQNQSLRVGLSMSAR